LLDAVQVLQDLTNLRAARTHLLQCLILSQHLVHQFLVRKHLLHQLSSRHLHKFPFFFDISKVIGIIPDT